LPLTRVYSKLIVSSERPITAMRDKTPIREQLAGRKSPSPQRVKPLTLGDLQRGGVQRIECECDWCRHEASIELAPLIEKAGVDATYRDVSRHFCCSVCGWRGISAWPIWPGHNAKRPRRGGVPLPSIRECRAVLEATKVDLSTQRIGRRTACVRALQERWPELTASAALFVVQQLLR
jgi:hypothetical protein